MRKIQVKHRSFPVEWNDWKTAKGIVRPLPFILVWALMPYDCRRHGRETVFGLFWKYCFPNLTAKKLFYGERIVSSIEMTRCAAGAVCSQRGELGRLHIPLRALAVCAAALWLGLVFSGCNRGETVVPGLLIPAPHASGDAQTGAYGQPLAKPFRVIVESEKYPGMLGGEGERAVVPNVEVQFTVSNQETGAVFEDSGSDAATAVTDKGGAAAARLILGDRPGDVYVDALLPAYPEVAPIRFRAIAGVTRIGKDLEAPAGGQIDEFGVHLLNPDGSPAAGVEAVFRIEGDGKESTLNDTTVVTDELGRAVTSWKLGKTTGRYFASIEIRDRRPGISPEHRFSMRSIQYTATALDKMHMFLVLMGSLAVFIFGMKLMSEGLQRMADRKLKSVLGFMTRNRFVGVLAGAVVTGVIQSSSATTVMTVGFVNAGLMTLKQAIGVIYGANIGTTMTAQIIAFRIEDLAYPAIALGLLLTAMEKRPKLKAFGTGVLGFGLLFLGMNMMSDILKPLRYSPEFVAWFKMFDCTPVDGQVPPFAAFMCIVIGTATTCVVQSSSATVGLVLALCGQGLISYHTALPLILGDNIGTTITANLAAWGANRNSKRAALAHTFFNLFGAAYMYVLLFIPVWNGHPFFLGLVNWLTPGDVFAPEPENLLRHVANLHTTFNVINVFVFLPLVDPLTRLCNFVLPITESDRDSVLHYLEPKLLQTPSIAIEQALREVAFMVRKGQNSMNESTLLLCEGKEDCIPKIHEREDVIDRLQREITEYLTELSRKELTPDQAKLIPAFIHVVNDAERLGDHAEELIELHLLLREIRAKFSRKGTKSLETIQGSLNELFDASFALLERRRGATFEAANAANERMLAEIRVASDSYVQRLEAGKANVQAGVIFLDALAHYERIAGHLVNIAERIEWIQKVLA